jgi:uncharacterized protein
MQKFMNVGFFVIFMLLAVSLLFGAHYWLYITIVKFFPNWGAQQKMILGVVLLFLAVSFIISALLFRTLENPITRGYYFLSGIWLGTVLNITLSLVLAWLIISLSHLFGWTLSRSMLIGGCFILALGFSGYGVWNSLHPRIKSISVKIVGLPDQWRGKKNGQLSDLHLGGIFREDFARQVVDRTNMEHPEMVVITGDLLDGMDGDLKAPAAPIKELVSRYGTYFVNGNHETYIGTLQVQGILDGIGVKRLDDEVVDVNSLKLIGVSYPDRAEKKDIPATVEKLTPQFSGRPNILLYHSPVNIERMKAAGVDLELCGHTHDGQLFPINFITDAIYKNFSHGLHVIGDYTLYASSGTGSWGPTMRTTSHPEITVITLE